MDMQVLTNTRTYMALLMVAQGGWGAGGAHLLGGFWVRTAGGAVAAGVALDLPVRRQAARSVHVAISGQTRQRMSA